MLRIEDMHRPVELLEERLDLEALQVRGPILGGFVIEFHAVDDADLRSRLGKFLKPARRIRRQAVRVKPECAEQFPILAIDAPDQPHRENAEQRMHFEAPPPVIQRPAFPADHGILEPQGLAAHGLPEKLACLLQLLLRFLGELGRRIR